MKRLLVLLAVVTLTTLAVPAQKVKIICNRATDFSLYKTYAWAVQGADLPPDHMVTEAEEFQATLKKEIDAQLQKNGFTPVNLDQGPDMVITFQISIQLRSSGADDVRPDSPTSNTKFAQIWVVSRTEGTLTVDLTDHKTGKNIWRGTATAVLDAHKREERLRRIAGKFFGKFPPKR
ncbi:MAG: DUF4136 domain-containing protein [Acidobacteria bacterium]|nr:DUF4136 domain-containing protein [Acidobacteriota bacterium]